MSIEGQGRNRRESFRCAVADTRQNCAINVGSEVRQARLLNQSAGGFAVLVDRPADLNIGDTAELRTDAGWFTVRLVHVEEVEAINDDAVASQQSPWFRLGFSRLGDSMPLDEPAVSLLARNLWFRQAQWYSQSRTPMIVGVLLAVAVAIILVGLLDMNWGAGQAKDQQPSTWNDWLRNLVVSSGSPQGAPLPRSVWPAADGLPLARGLAESRDGSFPLEESRAVSSPDNDRVETTGPTSFLSGRALHDTVGRLSGAAALLLPDVVKKLKLTGDQQKQIAQLNEETTRAIRKLYQQSAGLQRQQISEMCAQLFDEALQKALKLLTGRQRAEWESFTVKP